MAKKTVFKDICPNCKKKRVLLLGKIMFFMDAIICTKCGYWWQVRKG